MKFISILAWFFTLLGLGIITFIFWPVAKEEIRYNFQKASGVKYVIGDEQLATFERPLIAPNKDYSILIPKIGAVAPIIDNVDPSDSQKYLPALKRGVAHAANTGIPNVEGNVFLFAHSTDAFWNVNTYNAVFYLIGKLNPGDEIDIYYQGHLIKYQVYDKKVVDAKDTKYMGTLIDKEKTLTLQTCYPPGTTLERLVVLAKQVSVDNE